MTTETTELRPSKRLPRMEVDHVVLWVEDPGRALEFYTQVLGLRAEREREFEAGHVLFPSVRLNDRTILDLMARADAPRVRALTGGGDDAGGRPINHLCLSLDAGDHAALRRRLERAGVELRSAGEGAFGARGRAVSSDYFCDPDGNLLEVRHYG